MYYSLRKFIQTWRLALAICGGVLLYYVWGQLPWRFHHIEYLTTIITNLQPYLIFCMLFISFCKVDFSKIRLRNWHFSLLGIQISGFLFGLFLFKCNENTLIQLIGQICLLCFVTPTASSATVIVNKLQGDIEGCIGYTIISNLLIVLLLSIGFPFLQNETQQTFFPIILLLVKKTIPILILPILAAYSVHHFVPLLYNWIQKKQHIALHIWLLCIIFAIALSTNALIKSCLSLSRFLLIAFITLLCCIIQFSWGFFWNKKSWQNSIAASQSLGQKNTIFSIWIAYTYLNPICSIAGGFYTIFHNLWNSYQLAKEIPTDLSNHS